MFTLSPNDSPLEDTNELRDGNFGGRREHTTGKQVREQDNTKRSLGAPNVKDNPSEETARDIDEMSEPESRKREFSRRAETFDRRDHNKEHFHKSDPENLPSEDSSNNIIPDSKKHGDKLKNHFGEGQYEGEIK